MNADFLRGPGNVSICLARLIGLSAAVVYPFPYIWNLLKHGAVPDPASFGQGYALTLGAIGLMVGAKDWALGQAKAACGGDDGH